MGFCINRGVDPLVRAGRPRPACSVEESSTSETGRAGQGAGRGRGRPPHYLCRCALVGNPCGIALTAAAQREGVPHRAATVKGCPMALWATKGDEDAVAAGRRFRCFFAGSSTERSLRLASMRMWQ